jgi:hypothetical protein
MSDKIKKILELLGIPKEKESITRSTIERMIKSAEEDSLTRYCENEAMLFNILGVDRLVEKNLLTENEIQDLHDKIKYIVELNSETLNEAKRLYNLYFETKQASRDIKKIKKESVGFFDYIGGSTPEKIRINERTDPMVSGDKKQKIEYYDSVKMTYKGQEVNQDLIMRLLYQGIILMPDHARKADPNKAGSSSDLK